MPTVLVVDDDATVREVVVTYLEQAGYDTLVAPDGPNALVAARSQPDLVVLDVMLPGFDGFEVCRRLREERPELPIIMLTALGRKKIALPDSAQGQMTISPSRSLHVN